MPAFARVAANCSVAARHFQNVDRRRHSEITDGVHGNLQPGTVGGEYDWLESVAVPYQLAHTTVRIGLAQRCSARVDCSVEDELDARDRDRVAAVCSRQL